MTWFVVILLEIRTLVGVPKDGVKIEVCRRQWKTGELQMGVSGGKGSGGLSRKKMIKEKKRDDETYLIVIEVPIDRKAMLSFFLSLRC